MKKINLLVLAGVLFSSVQGYCIEKLPTDGSLIPEISSNNGIVPEKYVIVPAEVREARKARDSGFFSSLFPGLVAIYHIRDQKEDIARAQTYKINGGTVENPTGREVLPSAQPGPMKTNANRSAKGGSVFDFGKVCVQSVQRDPVIYAPVPGGEVREVPKECSELSFEYRVTKSSQGGFIRLDCNKCKSFYKTACYKNLIDEVGPMSRLSIHDKNGVKRDYFDFSGRLYELGKVDGNSFCLVEKEVAVKPVGFTPISNEISDLMYSTEKKNLLSGGEPVQVRMTKVLADGNSAAQPSTAPAKAAPNGAAH